MTDSTTGAQTTETTQVANTEVTATTTETTPAVTTTTTPTTTTTTQAAATVVNTPTEVKSWIADDWREKLANGDAKELARLQRFPDIASVYKSYREIEAKVSNGALRQPLPQNATEAQIAQYRKDNGIPETAGDYEVDIPEGIVLGEEDQTILGSVLDTMHKQNRTSAEVNEVVNSFLKAREIEQAAYIQNQNVIRVQTEEALRHEWGSNFLPNVGAVKNLLASAPDGLGEMLDNARLPDGSLLGNNPAALKWLAQLALDINPAGTVVPGATGNQMQSIDAELNELSQMMKTDLAAWRKNDTARARHRDLLDAKLKLQARGM